MRHSGAEAPELGLWAYVTLKALNGAPAQRHIVGLSHEGTLKWLDPQRVSFFLVSLEIEKEPCGHSEAPNTRNPSGMKTGIWTRLDPRPSLSRSP